MADFGKTFGEAFRFGLNAKRILPFFILNLIALSVVFMFINAFVNALPLIGVLSFESIVWVFLSYFIGFIVIGGVVLIIVWLANLYFRAAVVDNARNYWKKKNAPLSISFDIARKKFWSVLGATILVVAISVAVSMVPIIGGIISLIISWFFLFIVQFIVISNKNAFGSLKNGYMLFMKNKLDVFFFWLILLIISLLLFVIAMIPIMIVAFPIIIEFLQVSVSGGNVLSLLPFVKQHMAGLFAGSVVSMAILSYVTVFQEGASTFFFMKIKKK